MRRAALIVIAVVAIGIGLLLAASGIAGVAGLLHNSGRAAAGEPQALQLVTRVIAIGVVLAFVGVGVWAVVAGIAFLKRRRWARTSVVVICGLCFGACALMLFGCLIVVLGDRLNSRPPSFSGLEFAEYAAPFAFFLWALLFLNRRDVKAEFGWAPMPIYVPPPPPVLPMPIPGTQLPGAPKRPVLVTVIAWFMIIGSAGGVAMLPFYFVWKSWLPTILLGRLVLGWPVLVVGLANGVLAIAAGAGMLKAKNWARLLTIAIHMYGVLNIGLMLWNRGQFEQFESAILARSTQVYRNAGIAITPEMLEPFMKMMWFSMLMGLVLPVLIIWYLARLKDLGPVETR